MKHCGRIIGIAAAAIAWSGLIGCVDQEASLGVRGVVKHSGTRTTEEVECPSEGMGEPTTRSKTLLACDRSVEAGNAEDFLSRASIDISDFTSDNGGQVGPSTRVFSDEEFCQLDPDRYFALKYQRKSFELTLDTENRLKDSREVGAEGQGGGGGGYENLSLNTNDVILKELQIRYPDAPAGDLERTIQLSVLAESSGGGAAVGFDLFGKGDVSALQSLHQSLASSPEETVTVVVEFTVRGETLGGNDITSNTFTFPLQICGEGCGTTGACVFQSEGGGGGG